jgi:tetratricopeptide (TPR) repeat protein
VTIAALVAVATFAETAFAQVLPNTAANRRRGVVGCVQSGGGISCPGAPGGGGRSGYGYSGPSGADMMMGLMGMALDVMAQMEQAEQQQRMAYGQSLNQQGIRHYEGGNYQDSVNAFRQALSYLPGDSSVQGNLREAERLLAVEREKAEQENRRKMDEARSRIGVMLGQLQADFDGRAGGVSAIPNDGMDFAGPAGTSFFGTGGGTPTRIATAPSGGGKGGGDGLDFIGVGDSRFSKGGKGSAPPDLRPAPGAKDLGKDPGAEGGLDFLPAGQPVAKAPPSPTMQPPAAATTKPALKAVATAATAAATPRKPANTLVREAVEAGGGDWERARSRLADMARRNPDNAEARTALRQFEQLYADMRRAVHGANDGAPGPGGGNRPPLAPPRLVLDGDGPSAYEANRLANEAFYDAANGDLDRARRRLERARTLVPGDKALGEALAEIDFAQMARTKRAGERAGPAWAPPEGQAQAQSEASLGRWALESGRYDVAADAYAQAFVRDPSRRTQYDSSYTAARIGGILHSGRAPNPSVLAREGPVFDPPTGDGPSLLPQR